MCSAALRTLWTVSHRHSWILPTPHPFLNQVLCMLNTAINPFQLGYLFFLSRQALTMQPRLASNLQCSHHQSTRGLHAQLVCISVTIQQCKLHLHICTSNTHNTPEATGLLLLHSLTIPSTALEPLFQVCLRIRLPGDSPRQQHATVSWAGSCNEHNTLSHATAWHCWALSPFTPHCFLSSNLNYS